MRKPRRSLAVATVVSVASFGAGGAGALANHLVGCSKEQYFDWTRHRGSDVRNHCAGGDGKDEMWGYAEADELHGGLDQDVLRGAHGDDDLWDQPGSDAGDTDGMCLGDGLDYSNVLDQDGKDTVYDIPYPDGYTDVTDDRNQYDQVIQQNTGCPYAD